MSPAGYRFLLHVAPRIEKVLIPPTRGRLSWPESAGWGWSRRHARSPGRRARIRCTSDQRLRRAACDRVQLRARNASGLERQPAGAPRMHRRVQWVRPAKYRADAAHRRRPRLGMGHGHRLLRRLRTLPRQLRTTRDQAFPPPGQALRAPSTSPILGVHGLFSQPSVSDR